nr:unnamed protein product [Callosobruchus analis]
MEPSSHGDWLPRVLVELCASLVVDCLRTIIDSFTVGAVIAKLTRPAMSNSTIMFTRNAVICLMDGVLSLMFRVGDLRKRKLIGTSISAILIHTKRTKEGDRFENFQTPLELQCDDMGSEIFFLWPMTVIHKIDENSPFYNLSASQMLNEHFEIVVSLEGSVESTGQGTNAKTSYLSCEILWGQKFVDLLSFNEKRQSYEANFKLFDKMEWVETPFCSAAEFEAQASEANKTQATECKSFTSSASMTKLSEDSLEHNGESEEILPKDSQTDMEQELKISHRPSRYEELVRDWEYCRHQIPIYQDIIQEEDEDEDSDERGDTPPFPVTWVKYASDLQHTQRQCKIVRAKQFKMKSAHRTFYLTRTILKTQNAKSEKLSRQITEDGGSECEIYSELDRQKELPLLLTNNPNSCSKITSTSSYPRLGGLTKIPTDISIGCPGTTKIDSFRRSFRPNAVRKMRRRAVFKNGDCNILQSRISRRRLRYLQDIFTTLVDSQWRWTLTIFAVGFIGSWLIFALIWWLIAYTHGDLEEDHLPLYQADNNWTPCVFNIHGFTSCFLFSIETQHTIGYGVRTTTEECPEAIFIMCMQSISGMIIQSFMVGIVFAKMTRPKLRTQTLQFSRNAVVCQRDGYLCLMFRILNNFQTELSLNADACDGNLFFIWPMTVVHRIDENSPLYNLSAGDMLQERFEIVVILEGTVESTGQTTQARSSYIASEVLWGHRFEPVVSYNKDRQGYEVNYSKFDSTVPIDTPLCSGAELAEFYRFQRSPGIPCSTSFKN